MAHRKNGSLGWNALYGSGEDEQKDSSNHGYYQTPSNTTANYRKFLSERPPFATDDDDVDLVPQPASRQTHRREADAFDPITTLSGPLPRSPESPQLPSHTAAQRAQEMLAPGSANIFPPRDQNLPSNKSPGKKRKTEGHVLAQTHDASLNNRAFDQEPDISLYDDDENTAAALASLAKNAIAASSGTPISDVEADEDSDADEKANFAFRIDIQRCESFLMALGVSLKAYKENGSADKAAFMAKRLEKVVDALNRKS